MKQSSQNLASRSFADSSWDAESLDVFSASALYGGRLVAFLYRANSVRIAGWVFGAASITRRPQLLNRQFCGGTLMLNTSRSNAQRLLWLEGARYVRERRLLRQLVRKGMTIVDVGGNIGYYSLMFSSLLCRDGRVICLEPDPANLIELRASIEASQLADIIHVLPVAAGSTNGVINFQPGLNGYVTCDGSVEVPVRTIDSLNTKIDLLKIDVEGYEGAVLDGARHTIERHRPAIFVELHSRLRTPHTHREIVDYLRDSYHTVRCYRAANRSRFGRLLAAYGLMTSVVEVQIEDMLSALNSRDADVSWVIARSSDSDFL